MNTLNDQDLRSQIALTIVLGILVILAVLLLAELIGALSVIG